MFMGTWGEGNFDNDGALDYMAEITTRLVKTIEETLKDKVMAGLDEDGEAKLVPSLDILTTLRENYQHIVLPEAGKIESWKSEYLKIYDEQIDDVALVQGYKEQRRATIEATFDKLINLSRTDEERSKAH